MRVFVVLGFVLFAAFAAPVQLPEGEGRDIVERVCGSQCHGVGTFAGSRKTPRQWKTVVDEMAGLGAVATETELKSITVYLSRHFFPVVNINTASAREVSDALELPIREAETITQYREQHGTFKSWDDLAKVPDLDLKKIEQRKDRVVF